MDDLNGSLSRVVRLCIDACLFLDQLQTFDAQVVKLHSSNMSRRDFLSILDRLSSTLTDLNIYHQEHFSRSFVNVWTSLAHEHASTRPTDVSENLHRFNLFLHRISSRDIFSCLHRLHVTCSLWCQYGRLCSQMDFTERFVYLRRDLLICLRKLHHRIQSALKRVNEDFDDRQQVSRRKRIVRNNNHDESSRRRVQVDREGLCRTMFLWCVIILVSGCYYFWPLVKVRRGNAGWPM